MTRQRRADAFERHFPDAYRLAFHLTADERAAQNAVIDSFARCFSRFEHLRADDLFESALLGETLRASVPRRHRAGNVENVIRILEEMGIDPRTIAATIPSASRDAWMRPVETDELPLLDVVPTSGAFRETLSKARRRLGAVFLATALVAGAGTWTMTRGTDPFSTPFVAGELPDILPQSYAPTGPKIELVVGSLENMRWSVSAYRAKHRSVCIELRVDNTYGDVHCPSDFKVPLRAYVGPDGKHRTTFLYGYARSDVTDIAVKVKGSPAVGVEIGRDVKALGTEEPGGFFAVTVPGYLLPLSDRKQGEALGYRVYQLRLTASGANGKKIGTERLLLGRPG